MSSARRRLLPQLKRSSGIEVSDSAPEISEYLCHRAADSAEADDTDEQSVKAGQVVRQHARTITCVVAALDFGVSGSKAA
jgi:hypothetical protein